MNAIIPAHIAVVKGVISVIKDGNAPISVKSIINGINLDQLNQSKILIMVKNVLYVNEDGN